MLIRFNLINKVFLNDYYRISLMNESKKWMFRYMIFIWKYREKTFSYMTFSKLSTKS